MQNQKQFCFWKPSGKRTRLESSRSKLFLHQSVLGFKTYPCQYKKKQNDASREMHFLALTKLVVDDQLKTSKTKFQKFETICQNKLRIWTFQNGKITANNPNGNVQLRLQDRMAEQSKALDSRKLLSRDFWYTNVQMGSNTTPVGSFLGVAKYLMN